MLNLTLADAAVSAAKQRGHSEVTKGHLLKALLTSTAVGWRASTKPRANPDAAMAPPGTAIDSPTLSPEVEAIIDRCDNQLNAQKVALELITEFGLDAEPASGSEAENDPTGAASTDSVEVSRLVSQGAVLQQLEVALRRTDPPIVILHGRPGSGRTTMLRLLADHLRALDFNRSVRTPPVSDLMADPSRIIALRTADRHAVLMIDDVDLLLGLSLQPPQGPIIAMNALLAAGKQAIVLVLPTSLRARFTNTIGRLATRCEWVELPPLVGDQLVEAIAIGAERLSEHHQVTYTQDALRAAAAPASMDAEMAQPGLAIARLDVAAATVASRADSSVEAKDVVLGTASSSGPMASDQSLRERLANAVLGQEHAVDQLTRRLHLTRAQLDMRPERPDGVFLFVGPTGVGKTALARALALELFGTESNLIRLDMSEYSEPWAISRLTGPQPGYVGSMEPESWLTTKIRARPRAVLLLDEIEKAHPDVWNIFLQAFDAGRLTDSRGEVADFSSTVVIMTSNLGSDMIGKRSVGFGGTGTDQASQERIVMDIVRKAMRPELLNRLDSTVVFRTLPHETIVDIARAELARLTSTLGSRGYLINLPESALQFVADAGYDARYGARHLQRSIEQYVLEPLALLGVGEWRAEVDADHLKWEGVR